ncbi:MAG: acyl-CoA reductase [Bacteroidetes bacterium]|nr:acyl-CoA reductase [Bacteroidota bacterium]
MTLKQRTEAFAQLGNFINRHYSNSYDASETPLHQGFEALVKETQIYNNWFIPPFVNDAVKNIALFLNVDELTKFCAPVKDVKQKTVAVICAGNIPMVGFHDVMCVLLCGHKALIKLSSDDNILIPFFLKLLVHYQPEFENQILFADGKLSNFNAIIATGSNNTATHLHYYFSKYPHIIRKSRTSVAVLSGKESKEDLKNLGSDILQYFGLGCRNVSKLLVPKNYDFAHFFEAIVDFGFVINNKKYGNNYDYHRAIYLLESLPFLDNNFLMIRESNDLHSPVGVLYYQFYENENEVKNYLSENKNHIQCVVGKDFIPFGNSQCPVISDFADNINTVDFLVHLPD